MPDWILVVVIPGALAVADVQMHPMPEAQCRAALRVMDPLSPERLGLACIGPQGQTVEPEQR